MFAIRYKFLNILLKREEITMKSMKKVLAVILSVITLITAVPVSAVSIFAADNSMYGNVTAITDNLTVTDSNSASVKVNHDSNITLSWAKADQKIGRSQDGWWAGIKMTAPKGLSADKAKFGSLAYGAQSWSDGKSFWDKQDSDKNDHSEDIERYITLWSFVNQEKIIKAKDKDNGKISTQWHFDWDGDSSYEQSVVVELDVEKIILKNGETQVYPFEKYGKVEPISAANIADVNDSNSADVTVSYKDALVLNWSDVDNTTNMPRTKAGWWAGVKMTAPQEADLNNAKYNSKAYGAYDWSQDKSFDQFKDGENFITLWAFVNEESLNNALLANENISTMWRFDWNNDGVPDQKVTTEINPSKVVLNKNGEKIYPSNISAEVLPITQANKMTVNGSKENIVSVSNNDTITLEWSQANQTIGRDYDGWWAGINIIAPNGFTIDKAQYKALYNGSDSWKKKFFKDCKDSDNNITMWAFVDEDFKNQDVIQNEYQFDWDGDGVYEQYITFSLNTANIELNYANFYAMDKAAPSVSVPENGNGYKNGVIDVKFAVEDNGTESNGETYISGISKVYYSTTELEKLTFEDLEALNEKTEVKSKTKDYSFQVSGDFNGMYCIYAVDNAGNVGMNSIKVQLDNTAPEFTETSVDTETLKNTWTNGQIEITGKIVEELSGVASYEYDTKATDVNLTYDDKISEYKLTIGKQTFEGDITLTFKDNAGNSNSITFNVKMDDVKCDIISIEYPQEWVNKDFVIEGIVFDNASGVKSVSAKLDDDTKVQPQSKYNRENGSYTVTVSAQDIDGNCIVTFEDNAGNTNTKTVSVRIDTKKPVVDTAEASLSDWTNEKVTIKGNVSDTGDVKSDVKYVGYVKGDSIEDLTSENFLEKLTAAKFNAESGEYEFTLNKQNYDGNYAVYCIDNAGNISEVKTVAVKMDIHAPENMNVKYPESINKGKLEVFIDGLLKFITFGYYQPTVDITLSAEDKMVDGVVSGIKEFDCKVIDTETSNVIDKGTLTAENGEAVISIAEEGNYIVEFTVRDSAGNEVSYSSISNEADTVQGAIIDKTAPQLTSITARTPDIALNPKDRDETVELPNESSIELSKYSAYELFYDDEVTVKISINEANFDQQQDAENNEIIAPNKELGEESRGNTSVTVNGNEQKVTWHREGNSDIYYTEITLKGDGRYKIVVNCSDMSGNSMETYTSQYIIIDEYAPEITGFSFDTDGSYYHKDSASADKSKNQSGSTEKNKNNYDYYFEDDFTVTVKASDAVAPKNNEGESNTDSASGIKDIILIARDVDEDWVNVTDNDDLIANSEFENQKSFTIEGPFKGNLYAIAIDRLGQYPTSESNTGWITANKFYEYTLTEADKDILPKGAEIEVGAKFIAPNDSIIEDNKKHTQESDITVSINAKATEQERKKDSYVDNGWITSKTSNISRDKKIDFAKAQKIDLFKNNVSVTLSVEDKYSGIREVEWYVKGRDDQDSENNKSGKLIIDNNGKANKNNDTDWTFKKNTNDNLVLSASKNIKITNNSNDIIILVILTDRAGNKSYDYKIIGIDKTKPEISVEYSDSNQKTGAYENYYNHKRTATISIKERNFDAKYISTILKNIDTSYDYIPDIKNITNTDAWSRKGTSDNKTYSYKIHYVDDGKFRFNIEMTDVAGNKTSRAEKSFTIDLTAPKISIALDKNDIVKNNKYFNETRTAVIAVTEHNFNKAQFENLIKATLNGNNIEVPKETKFTRSSENPNVWATTVTFSEDGDYVNAFKYTDKAGNVYTASKKDFDGVAPIEFTIDKTAPEISIAVNDKYAYSTGPVVKVIEKDNNCSDITSTMTGVVWNNDSGIMQNVNVVSSEQQLNENHHNADFVVTYEKIKTDGFYTVNAKSIDMAGNESVTSIKTFTKNEYGAVYVPSYDLANLSYANKNNLSGDKLYFDEYSPNPIDADEN